MQHTSPSVRVRAVAPAIQLALVVATCAACATTSADFRMSSVGATDAAIAGRLTIMYNGQIFTENCRAHFGPEMIQLTHDGVVLLRVPKGWTSLWRLDCKDSSNQHVRIRGAHLYAHGDGWVTDFGDVAVTWHGAGGFKVSSLFGIVGGLIDEASDDGVASVAVKPPVAEVRDAFRRQIGGDGRWVTQPLSQPGGLLAVPQPDDDAPSLAPMGQRGFFCASASGRSGLSICERDLATCEHARAVPVGAKLAPCVASETAWCFAGGGRLACSQTEAACTVRRDRARVGSDLCGEQY
jgi:hypothetical protein